ncbi:MAG: hypothetical protein AB1730_14425 [Myxococcota bacterium]|jgi:hypothetical protein
MMRIVGILAVVLLAGCGVGADESYADLGVSRSGQALEQESPAAQVPTSDTQPTETTGNATPVLGKDPGTVALPQDPIPVFEGKPLPPPAFGLTVDPGFEGPVPTPPAPPGR